jgi:hypothetical protein
MGASLGLWLVLMKHGEWKPPAFTAQEKHDLLIGALIFMLLVVFAFTGWR